jgi:hypothetical protein
MLMEIGASPNLTRQDFPYEAEIYAFVFNLEPLSRVSLAKYVWAESPPNDAFLEQLEPVLGDARVNHLGSLYADIIGLTESIIEGPSSPDLTRMSGRTVWKRSKGRAKSSTSSSSSHCFSARIPPWRASLMFGTFHKPIRTIRPFAD